MKENWMNKENRIKKYIQLACIERLSSETKPSERVAQWNTLLLFSTISACCVYAYQSLYLQCGAFNFDSVALFFSGFETLLHHNIHRTENRKREFSVKLHSRNIHFMQMTVVLYVAADFNSFSQGI